MLAIINTDVVIHDHIIPDGVVLADSGTITAVGERSKITVPEGCKIIDAGGKYTAPGMIDIHTHSEEGSFFAEDPARVAKHFMKHGITTMPLIPSER